MTVSKLTQNIKTNHQSKLFWVLLFSSLIGVFFIDGKAVFKEKFGLYSNEDVIQMRQDCLSKAGFNLLCPPFKASKQIS